MKESSKRTTIPPFEQQLILAHIFGVSREYVLSRLELKLSKSQGTRYKELLKRRQNHEPMAYILGHKEFYGLDFRVTPDTLIPRPETELLVEQAHSSLRNMLRNKLRNKITVIDIGTGSGNIIVSLVKTLNNYPRSKNYKYLGIDISPKVLRIARHNAKKNKVDKKIKFIRSDLLEVFMQNDRYEIENKNLIIIAILPYLSKKIYSETIPDVKNFEPTSALLSANKGTYHYEKLFRQIKKLSSTINHCSLIIEISPEQKIKMDRLIKDIFPRSNINFSRDLSGKWRAISIEL